MHVRLCNSVPLGGCFVLVRASRKGCRISVMTFIHSVTLCNYQLCHCRVNASRSSRTAAVLRWPPGRPTMPLAASTYYGQAEQQSFHGRPGVPKTTRRRTRPTLEATCSRTACPIGTDLFGCAPDPWNEPRVFVFSASHAPAAQIAPLVGLFGGASLLAAVYIAILAKVQGECATYCHMLRTFRRSSVSAGPNPRRFTT